MSFWNHLLLIFPLLLPATTGFGQNDTIPQRSYETKAIQGEPPVIDGLLDDSAWEQVEWTGDFIQHQPYEGQAPPQETTVKILYDDKHLYFGFRCFHDEPEQIVSRMSRRDGFDGDWIEVNVDSYGDKRTAFSFTSSVSGVKGDEFVSNDGNNWDSSWDPIWKLKTNIDSLGWTAEVAIPLSQLRFSRESEQQWGIQITRRHFREETRSTWQYIPRNSGKWVSGFGSLRGIRDIRPKRQIELQPYVLAQYESFKRENGNPFSDGSEGKFSAGLDGKIGITNDLTLDFTINPDFGQVEADPSAIRLDGFQIFFSERRPFFIENRNLFNYNVTQAEAGGPFNSDNLFYSRRIGSSPRRSYSPDDGEYVDQPDFTTILGAAKFSGKTRKGLSVGLLETVTQEERATVSSNGEERKVTVEPLSNYTVARVQQDFNEGQTVIGGIFTHVHRDLDDARLSDLHRNAMTGGLDFLHTWKERTWRLSGNIVFSHVNGSTDAITNTQNSFERNFQRPDADHLDFDPDATSLTGTGGNLAISEVGGKFKFQSGITWRSPMLELNDMGFQQVADEINYYHWMGYRWDEPNGIFRFFGINYNHWFRWDFSGRNLYRAFNTNAHANFTNFWNASAGITYENLEVSNTWLRGGPAFRKPNGYYAWIYGNSDRRKKIQMELNAAYGHGFEVATRSKEIYYWLRYQPSDALNLSFGPGWHGFKREDQYVATVDLGGDTRYIISALDQQTFNLTMRLNYSISPDLTIQYYGQPFVSRARYDVFKRVLDPLADHREQRFAAYSLSQVDFDADTDEYQVDENGDGNPDFSFGNPDFNFLQFRSNLVLRWEYTPGSEIYLVWTQGATQLGDPAERLVPSLTEDLFSEAVHNTFLMKLTYRFVN